MGIGPQKPWFSIGSTHIVRYLLLGGGIDRVIFFFYDEYGSEIFTNMVTPESMIKYIETMLHE